MRFACCLLAFALMVTSGCQVKPPKNALGMSIHLPANVTTPPDRSVPAVIRTPAMSFLVDTMPVFTEADLDKVELKHDGESFTIRFTFDTQGTIELDALSNDKRGSLIVIFVNDQVVASPQLKERIVDGILEFTPDMPRGDAELAVEGLNATIEFQNKR